MTDDMTRGALLACHECDALHRVTPIPAGAKALCHRCGAALYSHIPASLNRALALNLTALLLFIMAHSFPFIALSIGGRLEENILLSGTLALFNHGYAELGVLVFLTSILFPGLVIGGMLYLLLPLKFGIRPWAMSHVYRYIMAIFPWSLIGVFMLGVLIAIVKLMDIAAVIPGLSLFSLAALLVVSVAATVNFDPNLIWGPPEEVDLAKPAHTASEAEMVSCHSCQQLMSKSSAASSGHCPRCGGAMHERKPHSQTRTWALILTAAMLYIPANLYPIMTVSRFGQGEPDTIVSGVIHLVEEGMWPLGLLVFFASIMVPVLKLLVLTFLLLSLKRLPNWRPRDRTLLFRVTEVVGAWSMVDIFLIAILTALVKLDLLATIVPGPGASFFAAVVVMTLLAAKSFDPRLIWDHCEEPG